MPDPTLRPALKTDAEFVFELKKATMGAYSPTKLWDWDDGNQRQFFIHSFEPGGTEIVVYDGHDIGCLIVEDRDDHLLLDEIDILPAYQNRGIGSFLIKHLIEQAHAKKLPVRLHALKANPAYHLYQRLGFQIVRETESYYIMQRGWHDSD